MPNPLLSPYRAGENRVTSSIMAVFERIELALVREILAAATESGDELRAVTFENQVPLEGVVADARISGRFEWVFETKTDRGAYEHEGHSTDQLRNYAEHLKRESEARLFVLTPDAQVPLIIGELNQQVGDRIAWISFGGLTAAIERVSSTLFSEQTRFLLTELVALFEADGLVRGDDTVIVAARVAWPEYLSTGAYICQPDRFFRSDVRYFGFYAEGAIQPKIATIIDRHPNVVLSTEEAERRQAAGDKVIAKIIERALTAGTRVEGESYGIFVLTGPDEEGATETLEQGPIVNDMMANGRAWGWTLSQRYTSLERLRVARTTSDLGSS